MSDSDLFVTHLREANSLAYGGQPEQALRALTILRRALERVPALATPIRFASVERTRADALELVGRTDDALESWDRVIELASQVSGPTGLSIGLTVQPLIHKAVILSNRDRQKEAAALLDSALDEMRDTSSPLRLKTMAVLDGGFALLQVLARLGRMSQALPLPRRVLELLGTGTPMELGSASQVSQRVLALTLADEWESASTGTLSAMATPRARSSDDAMKRAAKLYNLSWQSADPTLSPAALILMELGDQALAAPTIANPDESFRQLRQRLKQIPGLDESEWYSLTGLPVSALSSAPRHASRPINEDESVALRTDALSLTETVMAVYAFLLAVLQTPDGHAVVRDADLPLIRSFVPSSLQLANRFLDPPADLADYGLAVSWSRQVARALFTCVVSHRPAEQIHLTRPVLRRELDAWNGQQWLEQHDVAIPSWTRTGLT